MIVTNLDKTEERGLELNAGLITVNKSGTAPFSHECRQTCVCRGSNAPWVPKIDRLSYAKRIAFPFGGLALDVLLAGPYQHSVDLGSNQTSPRRCRACLPRH